MALCAMVLAATLGRAQSIEDAQALVSEGKWKEAATAYRFITQHWETSQDGGSSWTTSFDGIYRLRME